MKCPYCGKEIRDTAAFCGYCGNSIRDSRDSMSFEKEKVSLEKEPPSPWDSGAPSWNNAPTYPTDSGAAPYATGGAPIQPPYSPAPSQPPYSPGPSQPPYSPGPYGKPRPTGGAPYPKKKGGAWVIVLVAVLLVLLVLGGVAGFLFYRGILRLPWQKQADAVTTSEADYSEWMDLLRNVIVAVDDRAGVWPDTADSPFSASAKRIANYTDFSCIVVTEANVGNVPNKDYAANYFNAFLSEHQNHSELYEDCVVILINVGARNCYAVARGAPSYWYDWDGFAEELSPDLQSGEYERAVVKLLQHRIDFDAPEPEPTPDYEDPYAYTEPSGDAYLYPSDTRYITDSELDQMTRAEVGLVRNEMYARYGYNFQDETIREYFLAQSWYTPIPGVNASTFDNSSFNQYERANLETIINYEKRKGWRT